MSTRERFTALVAEHLGVEPEKLTDDADFWKDLGADSLDLVEVTMAAEEEFNIRIDDDEIIDAPTFGAALAIVEREVG